MPATASSTVRKRRLSSADRRTGGAALSSPITSANYLLGEPLRRLRRHLPISWGGVSNSNKETRRRLQRTPPRPGTHRVTRFWFLRRFTAVAYLWRPTFARTVGGPGRRTNCLHSATIRCQCQDLLCAFASTTFEVAEPWFARRATHTGTPRQKARREAALSRSAAHPA